MMNIEGLRDATNGRPMYRGLRGHPDIVIRTVQYIVACTTLLTVLRCRLHASRMGVEDVDDGVHSLLLVYASKGIPVLDLLEVEHIKDKLRSLGFDVVAWAELCRQRRDEVLSFKTTIWLLTQMGLQFCLGDRRHFFGGIPQTELDRNRQDRLEQSANAIKALEARLRLEAINDRTNPLTLETLARVMHEEFREPEIYEDHQGIGVTFPRNFLTRHSAEFWRHFHFLTGGQMMEEVVTNGENGEVIRTRRTVAIEEHERIYQLDRKAAVVAAVHVYQLHFWRAHRNDEPGVYVLGQDHFPDLEYSDDEADEEEAQGDGCPSNLS